MGVGAGDGELFVDPYGNIVQGGEGLLVGETDPLADVGVIDSGYVTADVGLFEGADGVDISTDPSYTPLSDDFAGFEMVNFATDSAQLSVEAQEVLERQAAWLAANPAEVAIIEGHCDERGTRDYNLALGQRRADSVIEYLISAGVAPDRLRAVSYGKERPLAEALCSAPDCWARNRRAVTVLQSGY